MLSDRLIVTRRNSVNCHYLTPPGIAYLDGGAQCAAIPLLFLSNATSPVHYFRPLVENSASLGHTACTRWMRLGAGGTP